MALTGAERVRRSRAHTSGDHSLCDPARCESAGAPIPEDLAADDVFGAAGRRLWREVTQQANPPLSAAQLTLLEEACVIKDLLADLGRALRRRGDVWRSFPLDDDGPEVRMVVDNAAAEVRQQSTALRGLIAEITKTSAKRPSVSQPEGPPAPDPLDEFRRRAALRRAGGE